MVFDINIISDIDEDIVVDDEKLSKEYVVSYLESGDATSAQKANMFADILVGNILSSHNPIFFFSEYKKGNIIIYPETALFKTLKFIPTNFIKSLGEKAFYTAKEKVSNIVAEEG